MARSRRPELAAPIQIQIRDWNLYGDARLKAPHFIMKPTMFFHDKRLEMEPELYRFFDYLIYHASVQRTPGVIFGDAFSLSRECRCHAKSVPGYISKLFEMQLIQGVERLAAPRLEEKRTDKNREEGTAAPVLELPGAAPKTWEGLWEKMPREAKTDLGITTWPFDSALELAARNIGGIRQDGKHLVTAEVFESELQGLFPGETRGLSDFTLSYCRLFLHQASGIAVMKACIKNYRRDGGKWDTAAQVTKYDDFKKWLYGAWWDWFYDEKTRKRPKTLVDSDTRAVANGSDIIHPVRHDIQNNVEELDAESEKAKIRHTLEQIAALQETVSKTKTAL